MQHWQMKELDTMPGDMKNPDCSQLQPAWKSYLIQGRAKKRLIKPKWAYPQSCVEMKRKSTSTCLEITTNNLSGPTCLGWPIDRLSSSLLSFSSHQQQTSPNNFAHLFSGSDLSPWIIHHVCVPRVRSKQKEDRPFSSYWRYWYLGVWHKEFYLHSQRVNNNLHYCLNFKVQWNMIPFYSEWGNFTPQANGFSGSALIFHIKYLHQQFLWRKTYELKADHYWYLPETRY